MQKSLKVFLTYTKRQKYLEVLIGLDGHKNNVIKSLKKDNVSVGLDVNNKPQYIRLTDAGGLGESFQSVVETLSKKKGPSFQQIDDIIEKACQLAQIVPGLKNASFMDAESVNISYNIRGES